MASAAIITGISLATSVAGGVLQAKAQKKVAKASRRAEDARERQATLEAQRARRRAIRETQIKRAEIAQNASGSGVDQASTPVQAGLSSATSQQNRQILSINQGEEIGRDIFAANRQIAKAQSQAATAGGIAGLGSSLFSARGSFGRLFGG